MIVVRLQGGLGNQMFQYAVGRNMSIKNNDELYLDVTAYENYELRKFGLNKFNIKSEIAEKDVIRKLRKDYWRVPKNILFHFFGININGFGTNYIVERGGNFNKNILKLKGEVYLEGYWQSDDYFKENEESIRRDFSLKEKLSEKFLRFTKKIEESNSVSVHIRRGDYVSNPVVVKELGFCGLDYYKKAIKFISKKVKQPEFYIFSDDMEWVRDNLKTNYPVDYISADYDYEDMVLISKCKNNIIANSSFSWWGAWLNPNKEKLVVAPKKWFNNGNCSDTLIPENWKRL